MPLRLPESFAVLTPIGYVTGAALPAIDTALREGHFLQTRALKLTLRKSRGTLSGRSLGRQIAKGLIAHGDVVVRLNTGEVYAWAKKAKDDITRLGPLAEILGFDSVVAAVPVPVRIVSGDPDATVPLIAGVTGLSETETAQRLTDQEPFLLDRRAAARLLVWAVHRSGLAKCTNQHDPMRPARLVRFQG